MSPKAYVPSGIHPYPKRHTPWGTPSEAYPPRRTPKSILQTDYHQVPTDLLAGKGGPCWGSAVTRGSRQLYAFMPSTSSWHTRTCTHAQTCFPTEPCSLPACGAHMHRPQLKNLDNSKRAKLSNPGKGLGQYVLRCDQQKESLRSNLS